MNKEKLITDLNIHGCLVPVIMIWLHLLCVNRTWHQQVLWKNILTTKNPKSGLGLYTGSKIINNDAEKAELIG